MFNELSPLPVQEIVNWLGKIGFDVFIFNEFVGILVMAGLGVQCGFIAGGLIASFIALSASWVRVNIPLSFMRGAILGGIYGGIFYPTMYHLRLKSMI